jgi:hypothetical protein
MRGPSHHCALFPNRLLDHLRSFCVFAVRLFNAPLPKPTAITVLVIDDHTLIERVKAEIQQCQIRVIDVGRDDDAFLKIWI